MTFDFRDEDFYLTEEDLRTAEDNGIHRDLARQRWYSGMDKQKAITMPLQNSGRIKRLHQQALENGLDISYGSIRHRMKNGLSEEEAVTRPVTKGKYMPEELSDLAVKKGIKRVTYWARRYRGWSAEKAASEPVDNKSNWRDK